MADTMKLRSDVVEIKTRAESLLKRTLKKCEDENRTMTAAERNEIQAILDEGKTIKGRIDRHDSDAALMAAINEMSAGIVPTSTGGGRSGRGVHSLGAQFTASAVGRWLRETKDTRAGQWQSPVAELDGFTMYGTTLDSSSASGGPLIIPDTRPGILPLPLRPAVIRDLVAPGTTTSNMIKFLKEKTFTNNAAAVLEGGAKPESALVFEDASSPVQKLAHWIPVTNEMLDDVDQAESYIDGRLRAGLQLVEDDELLNGSGVAPHLLGYMTLAGLAAAVARGADSNVDAVNKQIAAIATATNIMPDGIVMHPSNWLTIQLAKLATGEYASGSSPLAAPVPRVLWGLPVALTTAITLGTALVGCFRTASQIYDRGGVRVDASNSHSDFFTTNKVAIRCEERLALAVYREACFGKVTGLN